ncbi:DUF3806 domain-containing protein [Dermacoccaceae bacterium W4C1]
MQIQIQPVGPQEAAVLQEWLADAAAAGIDVDDPGTIEQVYDARLLQQLHAAPADREDPTPFCTMIGFALGEHLARHTDLVWRVVTDDDGTDLALSTQTQNAVLFPADPVAAAWAEQEDGWVRGWLTNLMIGLRGGSA